MKLKVETLLDQYKLDRAMYRIVAPIIIIGLVIAALILVLIKPEIWWVGLIFLGIATMTAIMCHFIIKYFNKLIKELEKKEAMKNAKEIDEKETLSNTKLDEK